MSIQQRKYYDITVQHLERFAKEGLRTLCLGVCRNLPISIDYLEREVRANQKYMGGVYCVTYLDMKRGRQNIKR